MSSFELHAGTRQSKSGREVAGEGSCPDWERLALGREEGDRLGSEGSALDQEECWRRAIEHQLECASCRQAALANDPTLVFQQMPEIELSAEEIETMRERVAGVRRGRAIIGGSADAKHASHGSVIRAGSGTMRRLVGAAAILVAILLGSLTAGWPPSAQPVGLTAADEAVLEASLGARPLVDGVDVYDIDQNVLLQGASGALDFAWVAGSQLDP